jgi:glycosyltransferase involved in cell wall biosynthesis
MPDRRYRVLMVASHPVQYMSPVFREMARDPHLDIQVAYCSMQGAEEGKDPGFGVSVRWDIPLFDGYPWICIRNRSPHPGIERFWGLLNPSIWKILREDRFDAAVSFTGYAYASFWILVAAAKWRGVPILFGTDATSMQPRSGKQWKAFLKRLLLPRIFPLANTVIVPSSAGVEFVRTLGIPPERVVLTPYTVDNEWWIERSTRVDRAAVRGRWGIPENASIALFCAKLQPWKRPLDLLRAFAKADLRNGYLVYAGDGPLMHTLESESRSLGISDRVRFLGFVNQSGLPEVYRSADLLVLPSDYEPFGVVVNEAMLCGCAVAASDRVGARHDLIRSGETGFIFPCGNVDTLAEILRGTLSNRLGLADISKAALKRMETWTIRDNVAGMVDAISRACSNRPIVDVEHPTEPGRI